MIGVIDVTAELAETKARLAVSQARLREIESWHDALLNYLEDGYAHCEIICDNAGVPRDYRILQVNPGYEIQTGLRASEVEGKTLLELFPSVETSWIDLFGRVVLTGEPLRFENFSHNTGRWFAGLALRLGPSHFGMLLRDITESKRREEVTRANEETHRMIFESAGVGMCCVGMDGRLARVNDKYCEVTGYSREELIGMPVLELTHPDDRKADGAKFRAYLLGQIPEYVAEKRYRRNDGSIRWVAVSARLVRRVDGRPQYSIGTVRDITERKEAREAIEQLLQRLKFHIENSPLAVIEFDSNLRICRWSSAAQRIFGWDAEEVLGKGIFEVPWVLAEEQPRLHEIAAHLKSGHDPRNVTANRNFRKDGSVIHCEWYNSSLQDGNGKLVSILSLVLDVTARERAESELRRQAGQLEQTVQERTQALSQTISELHQVSYSMVHDMRAPLRAMRSFSELAERECGDCVSPKTRQYHCLMSKAAARLDGLITDALNYTKVLHQEVSMVVVDLDLLVRGLLESYPNLTPDKADIRIEGRLPSVAGNLSFLTQCFSNLLDNAVKFSLPGSLPQIRVWAEPVPSDPGQPAPPCVRIWIEDHGVGIAKDIQYRLFGMFQKLDSTHEGTGIGLAIVRKVVERMGGAVGVESDTDRGARFWVQLKQVNSS